MLFTDLDSGCFGVQADDFAEQFLVVPAPESYACTDLQCTFGNPGRMRFGLKRRINVIQIEVIERDVPIFLSLTFLTRQRVF